MAYNISTVPVSSIRWLIPAGSMAGLDMKTVLREKGISPSVLEDQQAHLSYQDATELRAHVLSNIENEAIALHVGENIPIGELGVVDYIVTSSLSFSKAMENLCHYFRLIAHPSIVLNYSEQNDIGQLEYGNLRLLSDQQRFFEQQSVEFTFSTTISRIRAMTKMNISPKSVSFRHLKPGYFKEYEKLFQAPIRFGASKNLLIFGEDIVNLRLNNVDTRLHQILRSVADEMIGQLPETSGVTHQVLQILKNETHERESNVGSVAKKLIMSTRSLHRKLKQENTSFTLLRDQLRCEFAQSMLVDQKLTITDISFLLGFSQPSAFNRAFKRWTGFNPQQFRNQSC